MPSNYAHYITKLITELPRVSLSEQDKTGFARAIDYQIKFLPESCRDDLASLLAIECLEATKPSELKHPNSLDLDALKSILSRVQKRIYREIDRHKTDKLTDVAADDLRAQISPQAFREVLDILEAYITTTVSPKDGQIFLMRFIQKESVDTIAKRLGLGRSVIYTRLAEIERRVRKFLKELDIPQ